MAHRDAGQTGPSGSADCAGSSGSSRHRTVKYAVSKDSIGFKLLKKAGWKEGRGLGAAQQGVAKPLDAWHNKGKRGIGAADNTGTKPPAGGHEPDAKRKAAAADEQPQPKTKEEKQVSKRMKQAMCRQQARRDSAIDRHMRQLFNEPEPTTQHNPLLYGSARLSASNPLLDD
eukprot:jgi/Tetstr1/422157/TSEL_013011.t1